MEVPRANIGHSVGQFQLRGELTFSSGLMPVWVTLLGAAVVEELAWHVPLSFIDGYYQNEVVESGILYTANFPASMITFVLLMNWLYFRRRSHW